MLDSGVDANSVVYRPTGERLLDSALDDRDTSILEYLISQKAEINYINNFYLSLGCNVVNNTPLSNAIAAENLPEALIVAGAIVTHENNDIADAPLLRAVHAHNVRVLELLLDNNVNTPAKS